tara:strand:+ start:825 stop:3503 length:2679 start_codon:yes stop_codon:yes gene_type:complete
MSTWAKGSFDSSARFPLGVAIDPSNNYTYELQSAGTGTLSLVRRFYDTGNIDIAVKAQDPYNKTVSPSFHSGNLIVCDPGDSAETTHLYFAYHQEDVSGSNDILAVIKINGDGVIQWKKQFFNSTGFGINAIDQDTNNIYLSFQSTLGIYGGVTTIASINKSDGSKNWDKFFDGASLFEPQGMVIDTANSVGYVTGYKYAASSYGTIYDSKIIKFNTSNGTKVWSKELGGGEASKSAELRHPRLDSDGNLYVTTHMQAQADDGEVSDSAQAILNGCGLMKINSSGTKVWAYDYVSPMEFMDMCILRSNDSDGADTIVVMGRQVSAPNTSTVDAYEYHSLIGINTDGAQIWKYDFNVSNTGGPEWGGDSGETNTSGFKLLPDTNTGGFLLQCLLEVAGSSIIALMRRNADGTDTWTTPLTGTFSAYGNTSYTAGSTSSAYILSSSYTLSTDSGALQTAGHSMNNAGLGTFSTDTTINDYTINRYIGLEGEDFVTNNQATNLVGFKLDFDYDVESNNQITPLCNVDFEAIFDNNTDAQQSASANNTVGFPDPGLYVDDTYVDDTYVDAGFDAEMKQQYNTRSISSLLTGFKLAGGLDVDSDHQTDFNGGRKFLIDETLQSQNEINLNTKVTQSATASLDTDSQSSLLGGLALFGLLNALSENNIFVEAINSIVPEANLLADAQFSPTPGFLFGSGNVTYNSDADFTLDQTANTTAGLLFDGSADLDTDSLLDPLVGLQIKPGNQTFTSQHDINVVAGFLKTFASTLASDNETSSTGIILLEASQAFLQSQHEIDITTGRILFTEFNNSTDFQISIVGRRIEAADPYRAIEVGSETRIDIVMQETKIKQVSVETRVNTIQHESKLLIVPSETRNLEVLPDSTIKYRPGKIIAERI